MEPVGDGRAALKYLAPYVYRVAISNHRIVAVDESTVASNQILPSDVVDLCAAPQFVNLVLWHSLNHTLMTATNSLRRHLDDLVETFAPS